MPWWFVDDLWLVVKEKQIEKKMNSWGWTASRGIVLAIAENTSQLLNVMYKSRLCSQCFGMEERKNNGACSTFEYLDWYIKHESD